MCGDEEDCIVVEHELAERTGGALYVRGPGGVGVVMVQPGLDGPERRWAIVHELAHHDEGTVAPPATPALMERAEWRVERIAIGQLIPAEALEAFVGRQPVDEGVTAGEVAEEFGVPVSVAARALALLAGARDLR